jgi:thiamine pyrophosphate-dependent acetolactate synthase large subunit-like protein
VKRCWDVVVEALRQEKAGHVFGLPGNPEALYDSLYEAEDLETARARNGPTGCPHPTLLPGP